MVEILGTLQYFQIFTSPTVELINQSGDSDHVIYPGVTHRQNGEIGLYPDIKLYDWSKNETPGNPGNRLVWLSGVTNVPPGLLKKTTTNLL